MGNTESYSPPPRPKKFHLTPPRIFILRRDYLVTGHLRSGEHARRLFSDFLCPFPYAAGGTLILSEQAADNVFLECDADFAVGDNAANFAGGARVYANNVLGTAQISQKFIDAAVTYNPLGKFAAFARAQFIAGQPSTSLGFTWKPQSNRESIPVTEPMHDFVHPTERPKSRESSGSFGVGPNYDPEKIKQSTMFQRETGISLYYKQAKQARLVGTQASFIHDCIFSEIIAEVDVNNNSIARSDIGLSWVINHKKTKSGAQTNTAPGNLEIAFSLKNVARLFDDQLTTSNNEEPKLVFSFFKHLVIPRKIFVAYDSRFKLISNYIDLGFEIAVNPLHYFTDSGDHHVIPRSSTSTAPSPIQEQGFDRELRNNPVDFKLAAAWQINKNNLSKLRVDQTSMSVSHTVKAWWKPRFSLSVSSTYDWRRRASNMGVWLVLDTQDNVEHETAMTSFKDTVGYTVASQLDEIDDDFV